MSSPAPTPTHSAAPAATQTAGTGTPAAPPEAPDVTDWLQGIGTPLAAVATIALLIYEVRRTAEARAEAKADRARLEAEQRRIEVERRDSEANQARGVVLSLPWQTSPRAGATVYSTAVMNYSPGPVTQVVAFMVDRASQEIFGKVGVRTVLAPGEKWTTPALPLPAEFRRLLRPGVKLGDVACLVLTFTDQDGRRWFRYSTEQPIRLPGSGGLVDGLALREDGIRDGRLPEGGASAAGL